jgi:hypothetical protein
MFVFSILHSTARIGAGNGQLSRPATKGGYNI